MTRLAAFLSSQAPALRGACATTLACEIALAIVMALHLPNPAWALITVFVLATPTAGSSIQKGLLRIIGTLAGAGLAILLIEWCDQLPVAFSLALFAISVVASYGASSARYPYVYLIGFITVVIVAMDSLTMPERTVHLAAARAVEVCIGVATAALVRLSLWPVRASATLRSQLAATLEQCGPLLAGTGPDDRDAAVVALIRSRQQHQALLQTTGGEGGLTRAEEQRYGHAVAAVRAVIRDVLAAEAIVSAAGADVLGEVRTALARAMRELAQALRRERQRGGAALASALAGLRVDAGAAAGDARAAYAAALARVLTALTAELQGLARLSDYLGPGCGAAPAEVDAAAAAASPPAPRLRLDRARVIHAIKVTIVVESVLWLWMLYHLPGGMQGLVSALILAQPTIGATLLKGRLRLLGAVCGGTLGILVASFLIPGVSSLGVFCLLTAPILFASAWLNDGSRRYGYVGFQTGFAFILTLVAGSSPEPNSMAPVLRVCGILIGVGVASVIMTAIAPIDAWNEGLRGLGQLMAVIARGLAGADARDESAERVALRDQTAAYLAELCPGAVRRGWPRWSLERLLAFESRLGALIGARGATAMDGATEPELTAAAAQLAAAGRRLASDVEARRATQSRGEVAAANAAVGRALRQRDGAPAPPAVLERAGALQTAAALLAAVDHMVG